MSQNEWFSEMGQFSHFGEEGTWSNYGSANQIAIEQQIASLEARSRPSDYGFRYSRELFDLYNNRDERFRNTSGPTEIFDETRWVQTGEDRYERMSEYDEWKERMRARIRALNAKGAEGGGHGGWGAFGVLLNGVRQAANVAKFVGVTAAAGGLAAYGTVKAIKRSRESVDDNVDKKSRITFNGKSFFMGRRVSKFARSQKRKHSAVKKWNAGRKRRFSGRRGQRRGRRGGAVTFQKDVVNTYRGGGRRRRRVPSKAFKRNFMSMISNNAVKRTSQLTIAGAAGAQGFGVVPGAFSFNGTAGTWNDIVAIQAQVIQTPTFLNALTGTRSEISDAKVYFKNCYLEMDITNTGATPCVVEIYSIRARRNIPKFANSTPIADYSPTPLKLASGTGSLMAGGSQYVTPFDMSYFCTLYKILGCKKIYLQAGGATDLSTNVRGFTYDPAVDAAVTAATRCCYGGKTFFYLIVGTGAPEDNAGTPRFSASQLSITVQRAYNVKPILQNPVTATYNI